VVAKRICIPFQPPSKCTFPYTNDTPASASQRENITLIALLVGADFGFPEILSGLRQGEQMAVMAMPEATMHEDDGAVFRQHYIGFAGEAADMQAIAEPARKQQFPEH